MNHRLRKIFISLFRFIGWTVGALLLLLLLLKVIIALPPVQNKIKAKLIAVLEEQLHSEVSIGSVHLGFPKKIRIEQALIIAPDSDTLMSLGKLEVNVRILPLLNRKIVVRYIGLENTQADVGALIGQLEKQSIDTNGRTASEKSPPEIILKHIRIRNSIVKFSKTGTNGFNLMVMAGDLEVNLGRMDFDEILFARSASIRNTRIAMYFPQEPASTKPDTVQSDLPPFRFGKILLDQVEFDFSDTAGGLDFNFGTRLIRITDLQLDLSGRQVVLKRGDFRGTDLAFTMLPDTIQNLPAIPGPENPGNTWRIEGGRLSTEELSFRYDDASVSETPGLFNPSHIYITSMETLIRGFLIDESFYSADIRNLSFHEQCGLEISQLRGELLQADDEIALNNFLLTTPNSRIELDILSGYTPRDEQLSGDDHLSLDAVISMSNLYDLAFFYPVTDSLNFLNPGILKNPAGISAKVRGDFKTLNLEELKLNLMDSTRVHLTGHITDPGKSVSGMSLRIAESFTSRGNLTRMFNSKEGSSSTLPTW